MISDHQDYLYVPPMGYMRIDGSVFPARVGTPRERILRGEDMAFLGEALAERARARTGSIDANARINPWAFTPNGALKRERFRAIRNGMALMEGYKWLKEGFVFTEKRGRAGMPTPSEVYEDAFLDSDEDFSWNLPKEEELPGGADRVLKIPRKWLPKLFADNNLMVRSLTGSGGITHDGGLIIHDQETEGEEPQHSEQTVAPGGGYISAAIQPTQSGGRITGQFVEAGAGHEGGDWWWGTAKAVPNGGVYYFKIPYEEGLLFTPPETIPVLAVTTRTWKDGVIASTHTDMIIPEYSQEARAFAFLAQTAQEIGAGYSIDRSGQWWARNTYISYTNFAVRWGFPATLDS